MRPITLLILLLLTFNSTAQEVAMIKSEIFKNSKVNNLLKFSLEDEKGGLINIRSYSNYGGIAAEIKGYYIRYFDSELNLLKDVEYKVDKSIIKNAFIKGDTLHLIEYAQDKKSDRVVFNAVTARVSDLEFSKKELLSLSEEKQQKYFGISAGPLLITNKSQRDGNHEGEVVLSENNEYFVINFDINNKNKETHRVFVFNNNLEQIYTRLIEKDIKDKYFDYNDITVDDTDGTIYFLGKSFENESRKSKKKGKANYHFELYKVDAKGQSVVSFKHSDKFISALELLNSEDRIACVGLYGNYKQGMVSGACLFNLNSKSLEMEEETFSPFSEEFFNDRYGDKENRKEKSKTTGIANLDFKSIDMMPNGDIVLIAEEISISGSVAVGGASGIGGGTRTKPIAYFDDIVAVRIDSRGGLKWSRNINKQQTGFVNSSFTPITVGEDSYFFLNCSDKMKTLSGNRISFRQTSATKSNLYVIKIDGAGQLEYKKLIDDKDSKVFYKVNRGNINKKNHTVIIAGVDNKKTRILKLKI